jgi:precorrin-6A/cobalt-precorrin-6A reductase
MPVREQHLLILGGTAEARALAEAAVASFASRLIVTTSLAGRTRSSAALAGAVRRGGFGGAAGLEAYLRDAAIDLVIDATHPFATQISAAARAACASSSTPLLALSRPSWLPQEGDRWVEVADAAEAAMRLPGLGQRVLLTIGHRDLAAFTAVPQIYFIVRLIEPPPTPLPLRSCEVILARGPFTRDEERDMMMRHAIDVLVTKASGGDAMAEKLSAARDLGLPVVMLRRPPASQQASAACIEDALSWIAGRLAREEDRP